MRSSTSSALLGPLLGLLVGFIPGLAQDSTELAAKPKKHTAVRAKSVPKATIKTADDHPANPLAAGKGLDDEFGWTVVTDPATGVRIGLPAKMVPVARDAANGTRWSSHHSEVQIETFRIKTTEALSTLFDQQKHEPGNRQVEYSTMKPDNFFISGLQGLKKFSVRAQLKDGELRGVTMLFDQAMEGIMAPVMVAMTSAFAPFPEAGMPYAALSKTVEYGTGLIVSSDGYLVADRKVTDNCQVIVASGVGNAERIGTDASGVALLRVYGKSDLKPVQLAGETPKTADLTLLGVPDPNIQDGDRKAAVVRAKLIDGSAIELSQSVPVAGFSGAAAMDSQGRVLGVMQMRNAVLASASEPIAPPVRLIGAGTISNFLAAHGIAAAATAGDPKAAVVRIICVRK